MVVDDREERDVGLLLSRPAGEQLFLMPVSMRDWLEEGLLAWFIIDVVAELDTSALHARHPNDGVGRPAYDPEMMCALLLYAYSNGLRSSRRIEASCRTDAAYRVICGGLVPDHSTIARFVVDHQDAIEGLFVSGLRLCAAAGLVDLSVLALDDTKIGADAALDQNRPERDRVAQLHRARRDGVPLEVVALAVDAPQLPRLAAGNDPRAPPPRPAPGAARSGH
jgi:transposase